MCPDCIRGRRTVGSRLTASALYLEHAFITSGRFKNADERCLDSVQGPFGKGGRAGARHGSVNYRAILLLDGRAVYGEVERSHRVLEQRSVFSHFGMQCARSRDCFVSHLSARETSKRTYGAGDEAACEQVSTEALEALARGMAGRQGVRRAGSEKEKESEDCEDTSASFPCVRIVVSPRWTNGTRSKLVGAERMRRWKSS